MPQARFIYGRGYNFNRFVPFIRTMHGFVLNKPARIRRWLVANNVTAKFEAPTRIHADALLDIHTPQVINGLRSASALARAAEFAPLAKLPAFVGRRLFVKPQLLACDGTRRALAHAAEGDWVFNLSGGFHHARPDLSHGFCLVNDVAWAVHQLNQTGQLPRILVLDLDLHQGDGNSAAFRERDDVFTASLHQQDTFPEPKLASDLDRGLVGQGIDDTRYLSELDAFLTKIEQVFQPQVVVYIAGTDPFRHDAIGGFSLTIKGLVERDRRVAAFTRAQEAGLVVLPAGGYSSLSAKISALGMAVMHKVCTR